MLKNRVYCIKKIVFDFSLVKLNDSFSAIKLGSKQKGHSTWSPKIPVPTFSMSGR